MTVRRSATSLGEAADSIFINTFMDAPFAYCTLISPVTVKPLASKR